MKQIWETWEIRALMVASLVIQALLSFLAPLRKRSADGFLKLFLWLLYLSADSVALLAIGLISRIPQSDADQRADILVFWAPFLLLHLGGPDTITALALEDNELWLRHALQLATQTAVTIYVFGLSVGRGRHNRLWIPSALMFMNGFTKFFERTCALYFASREGIRASLEEAPETSSFNRWADEFYSAETAHIPARFEVKYGPAEAAASQYITDHRDNMKAFPDVIYILNKEIVNIAYSFYDAFKGILADDFLSIKDDEDRVDKLFLGEPVLLGLKIIETELNLIYDILHTKVFLVYKKRAILRLLCFLSVVTASLLFLFSVLDKDHRKNNSRHNNYNPIDVGVTFALLGGAIFLDVANFLRFLLSDWCIVMVTKLLANEPSRLLKFVLSKLLSLPIATRDPFARRWCESTSSYNLLDFSLRRPVSHKVFNLISVKQIKDLLMDYIYVVRKPIWKGFIKFIFLELQQKAKLTRGDNKENIEQVCLARGNLVLEDDYFLVSDYLRPWTVDIADYSQSLLTWHLATDICYWIESADTDNTGRVKAHEMRYELSKKLSDYMVYILLRRQELVPQLVGKSDVHFKSTASDIINAFGKTDRSHTTEGKLKIFSDYVLNKKLDDKYAAQISNANNSHSVFHEACCLAKQLMMFGEKKWEIISKVWVELMCYAAIRSSPRFNLALLSQGGELITLVWLYMCHLGFRLPIPQIGGLRSAQLIIDK